ncbi:MAG: hypothetical protein CL792_02735 [Chloroflexi bacterium]|nr:hypothetical protein [Chloroflexota bacterium]|tara:strand:- start:242 stop:880 length:639 start_codon:yes stop_codon:yes gene_type:complete
MLSDFNNGQNEIIFLRQYSDLTLRSIEVSSDALLERLFLAETSQRNLLGLRLLSDLSESAQRLMAVFNALSTRTVNVAKALTYPLPESDKWDVFCTDVIEIPPETLIRKMGIDERAIESASELSSLTDLPRHKKLIQLHSNGNPNVLIDNSSPTTIHLLNHTQNGKQITMSINLSEEIIVAIADTTGQFVRLARDFLLTNVEIREESFQNSK